MATNNQPVALIIIDMQRGMSDSTAGERNNPDAEDNIQRLLTKWRNAGWRGVSASACAAT